MAHFPFHILPTIKFWAYCSVHVTSAAKIFKQNELFRSVYPGLQPFRSATLALPNESLKLTVNGTRWENARDVVSMESLIHAAR